MEHTVQSGLGYVAEKRIVFKQLTVEENLRLGQKSSLTGQNWTTDEVYELFPRLAERRNVKAGYLSGGEQQMLTIVRTILGNPSITMIDEPPESLAPTIVERVGRTIVELKKRRLGVLLLEQKLALALDLADRVMVMGHGQIVFAGATSEFSKNDTVRQIWLEVG